MSLWIHRKILLIGSNIILLICFYILNISMHVSIVWIFYTIKEGEENTAENTIYISSSIQKEQLLWFTAVADVIAKDRMCTLLASWYISNDSRKHRQRRLSGGSRYSVHYLRADAFTIIIVNNYFCSVDINKNVS